MADNGSGTDLSATLAEARARIAVGDYDHAFEILERAKDRLYENADVLSLMGVIAIKLNNIATAIKLFDEAQSLPGASSDIPEILAVLHALVGNLPESLFYGKLGTVKPFDDQLLGLLKPRFPHFAQIFSRIKERPLVASGEALLAEGRLADAVDQFSQHVTLFPNDEHGLDGLTRALLASGEVRPALDLLRSLVAVAPGKASSTSRLAQALTQAGNFDDSHACHRLAGLTEPKSLAIRCRFLNDLVYRPDADTVAVVGGEIHALLAAKADSAGRRPAMVGGRTVHIGYLVGSLPGRDEATMLAGIARQHDRSRFSIIGLGEGPISQPQNRLFQMRFDRWLDVKGVDEQTFASMVRGEGIGILIDASGLGAPTQLSGFALHAAPLQLGWLGNPFGLDMPGGDHILVDANDHGPFARPCPLDDGLYTFPAPSELEPLLLRSDNDGRIGFGADATMADLNPDLVMTWARILMAVPDSMLLLRDRGHSHPANVARTVELFGNFAVAGRVDVVSVDSDDDFLSEIDIQLTPFPAAKPFAAARALVHGVPVIALDRPGWSSTQIAFLLKRLGLDRAMAAASEDDYVAQAVAWATDKDRRVAFRNDGPAKVAAAPIFDVAAFTAGFETALDALWRKIQAA